MCGVIDLGGGPRGLRLLEQLEHVAVRQLDERTIGRTGTHGGVMCDAAIALGAGAALEDQSELIATIHRDTPGRRHLPALAVDDERASCHRYACDVVATGTSLHSSHASGA